MQDADSHLKIAYTPNKEGGSQEISSEELMESQIERLIANKPTKLKILFSDEHFVAFTHSQPCAEQHICVLAKS